MTALTQLYRNDVVDETLVSVSARHMGVRLGLERRTPNTENLEQLRVAAISAFVDSVEAGDLESWLRDAGDGVADPAEAAVQNFELWKGFLKSAVAANVILPPEDLLFFAAAGMLARRPHEVRDALRRSDVRGWLNSPKNETRAWPDRVREETTVAMLLVVRQESRADVTAAGDALRRLATQQAQSQEAWLGERERPKGELLQLLGLYNLGHAVVRTAEFLISGSLEREGRPVNNPGPEIRRLLIRAEEFLQMHGDVETLSWLMAVGIVSEMVRRDSVWARARGMHERIDQLLAQLTQAGRENPVFSLLPSQQDALRQSLLDPNRLAIVLQMPTSAGKTLLAEFSIVQAFGSYPGSKVRIAYVVPTRALATQVRRTLAEDLGPLSIKVSAAGSAFEEDPFELKLLEDSDGVVVTTPEKLDLMLRAHPDWFRTLRLVVVDEAHLLSDGDRGARLELLITNLKRESPETRLLLLTPFVENAEDIARWLHRERSLAVQVQWRPSRVALGIAKVTSGQIAVKWRYNRKQLTDLIFPTALTRNSSLEAKTIELAKRFAPLGTVLAVCSASKTAAEKVALAFADANNSTLRPEHTTPALRLAIALAKHEYGADGVLPQLLARGVAFHHSALSPILRYLIEDQIRRRTLGFVAATSTLAQGMNFPVAAIIFHSNHKPYGNGRFTSPEFWNIAGRAGRVGMVEDGFVVFANEEREQDLAAYGQHPSDSVRSALISLARLLPTAGGLKSHHQKNPVIRPFFQYLVHAAAGSSTQSALNNLDELLQECLAYKQIRDVATTRALRALAHRYLVELGEKPTGYLKVTDSTGFVTFSFDELFAKLRSDPVLTSGPQAILTQGRAGLARLVEALRWLPEMNLAVGKGSGPMDVQAVARVVQGWMEGRQAHELASEFGGHSESDRIRHAAAYLYSTVSQTIAWGSHAYLKGWHMTQERPEGAVTAAADEMLPAYIQYGVRTAEAAVASLLGVPRPFAEGFGQAFRSERGPLTPETAPEFRSFIEQADESRWTRAISTAEIPGLAASDVRAVFREMQGLTAH